MACLCYHHSATFPSSSNVATMSSSSPSQRSRAAVIGAGPVGCLAALSLAARGFEVDVYERRPDPRSNQIGSTSGDASFSSSSASKRPVDRSINLAISSRGLKALATVEQQAKGGEKSGENLANVVLSHAVPMKARMIHTKPEAGKEVELMSQAYGMKGEVSTAQWRSIQPGAKAILISPDLCPPAAHQLRLARPA